MKVRSYKELDVWKKGIEIVDLVYEVTNKFQKEERYGLAAQMQRASVSIPSNIAEGFSRKHTKEYQQFCYIALGSCAELETQLIIAQRRNYVSAEDFATLEEYLDHESRMLMNLIKSLKSDAHRTTNHEPRTRRKI
ncbi:MAG: four helix bundle protein [Methanophagales archaeon]|nr:four helix bundle protein [Methanophagales archaeon]